MQFWSPRGSFRFYSSSISNVPSNSTNKSKSMMMMMMMMMMMIVIVLGFSCLHFSQTTFFSNTAASVMNSQWIFSSFFFISLWRSQECVQVAKDRLMNRHVLLPWQHMVRQWSYQLYCPVGTVLYSLEICQRGTQLDCFFSAFDLLP